MLEIEMKASSRQYTQNVKLTIIGQIELSSVGTTTSWQTIGQIELSSVGTTTSWQTIGQIELSSVSTTSS